MAHEVKGTTVVGPGLREFRSPETVTLSEFLILRQDIDYAGKAVSFLRKEFADHALNEAQFILAMSLFRDAIMQFVGCFEYGRYKLSADEVYGKIQGGPAFFKWLKDLRDNYAAHNHGPNRQCQILAEVSDDGTIGRWGNVVGVTRGVNTETLDQMLTFFTVANNAVNDKIAAMEDVVKAQINALTPTEALALPTAVYEPPGPFDIDQSRKQFRAAGVRTPTQSQPALPPLED